MSTDNEQFHISRIQIPLNNIVVCNLTTGLAYGFFLAVCFISVKILLSKGPLSLCSGSMFLFGITTIIFILSTTFMVLGPGLTSQLNLLMIHAVDPSFDRIWSLQKINVVRVILAIITRLVLILSDMVCAWRAMVVWKYDRRVVIILSICLLGTFAACIYELKSTLQTQVLIRAGVPSHEDPIMVIVVGPILATNVLSTSLIAWKAWDYHETVGAHFRKGKSFGRVEKVLLLLIESGFVYCILWTLYLLNAFDIISVSTSATFPTVMFYISSTYPLIINVLTVTTQSGESSEVWVQSVQ